MYCPMYCPPKISKNALESWKDYHILRSDPRGYNPPSESANKYRSFIRLRIAGRSLIDLDLSTKFNVFAKGVGIRHIAYLVENYLN